MSKPLEVFLEKSYSESHEFVGFSERQTDDDIHVIEYSAYEALKNRHEECLNDYFALDSHSMDQFTKLKDLQAKLDKAVEALECCANDDRRHQSVAFEALQEITADQNKSGET